MKITIGSKSFTVTLYENPTVTALKLMLPLTLEMTELNGNEKYFHLTTELPIVRRFRDATIKEECKSDYPHALQALWKALDRAEDLIQS